MLTFVFDNPQISRDNLYPLIHKGMNLTEPCWLTRWFDSFQVDYNIVGIKQSTSKSWYPITINFWDFDYNYLQSLNQDVVEKLVDGNLRLLFLYREADDPRLIQKHIQKMCDDAGARSELVWLISGNSQADSVSNCRFFWYFDINYFFQTQKSVIPTISSKPRNKNITCLSRVDKPWREWFVYNLSRFIDLDQNYISYGAVKNLDKFTDVSIWQEPMNTSKGLPINALAPNESWRSLLPLKADDLTSDKHNDHTTIVEQHFQNSYWNVVLETLLETELPNGVFVTEKTLKPIRNGQSFLILGCAGTLEFLKDKGYQTFENCIDESYDLVTSVHDRWYQVYQLTLYLAKSDGDKLRKLQSSSLPIIHHNQQHFQRSRHIEIKNLAADLDAIE